MIPLSTISLSESRSDGVTPRESHHEVNAYFTANPDRVLGVWAEITDGRRGRQLTVRATGDALTTVRAALAAFKPSAVPSALNDERSSNGSAPIITHPAEQNALALYEAAKALLRAQTRGECRAELQVAQAVYAVFTERWGTLRAAFTSLRKGRRGVLAGTVLSTRREAAFLLSLETVQGKPSALLAARVLVAPERPSRCSLADALLVSLDETGDVEPDRIYDLTDILREEIPHRLIDEGLCYRVPPGCVSGAAGELTPAIEYLTGDVGAKLRTAEIAAAHDPVYLRNVEALRGALPDPLGPDEISVGLGAEWVPGEVYKDWLYSLFPSEQWGLSAERSTAGWIIGCTNPQIEAADSAIRTARVSGLDLLRAAMNSQMPVVNDEVKGADGWPRKVRNEAATMEAQARVAELRAKFDAWVFSSTQGRSGETGTERATRLCAIYNEHYNGHAPRDFSGDHLTFDGLAATVVGKRYELKSRQRRGVAKVLAGGTRDKSAFLVYPPGFGKTDPAICASVKLRQLRLARRTLFVVPKSSVDQWYARFLALFPGAADEVLCAADPVYGADAPVAAPVEADRSAILVCIPREQQAAVEAEEADVARRIAAGERDITYYWTVARLPKKQPERIYFVWADAVRAWHRVVDMEPGRVVMAPEINEIEPVACDPFRGWRYWRDGVSRGASSREVFLSRVATGGWPYVIVSHEMLGEILLSEDVYEALLSEELSELRDSLREAESGVSKDATRLAKRSLRDRESALERSRVAHRARWQRLRERGRAPVSWEDCGIDHLVYDEAQTVKNLGVVTRMERVAGIPRSQSARAYDAWSKFQTVMRAGGRVTCLSGTPLTNTLAEAFVWMKMLQPNLLAHLGLQSFDAWASVFAEAYSSVEMDCVGKFRAVTRLRFRNVPELLALLGECWDFVRD